MLLRSGRARAEGNSVRWAKYFLAGSAALAVLCAPAKTKGQELRVEPLPECTEAVIEVGPIKIHDAPKALRVEKPKTNPIPPEELVGTVIFPVPDLMVSETEVLPYSGADHTGAPKYQYWSAKNKKEKERCEKDGKECKIRPHAAIDIYSPIKREKGALKIGSPVVAIADGVLVSAGYSGARPGYYVSLRFTAENGHTYTAEYRHLAPFALSRVRPARNQVVKAGEVLGEVGNTGNARGIAYPILCFALHDDTAHRYVDPWSVLLQLKFTKAKLPKTS